MFEGPSTESGAAAGVRALLIAHPGVQEEVHPYDEVDEGKEGQVNPEK